MRSASLVVLVVCLAAGPTHAATPVVQITACGQAVPPNSHGILMHDLDCTGFVGGIANEAVAIGHHSTLDLGGFTVTGGRFGVACFEVCTDGSTGGVACWPDGAPCAVANGTVTGATASGIIGDKVTVRNVTVSDNGEAGVQGYRQARVIDSSLTHNGDDGVHAWTVTVVGSTITDNARFGVAGGKYRNRRYTKGVTIRDSTVTDNGTSPDCGTTYTPYCADVFSGTRPKVAHSICDTSGAPGSFGGCGGADRWCVCSTN